MDAECRLLRAHDNAFAYTLKTTCHAVIVSKDEYLAFLFFSFLSRLFFFWGPFCRCQSFDLSLRSGFSLRSWAHGCLQRVFRVGGHAGKPSSSFHSPVMYVNISPTPPRQGRRLGQNIPSSPSTLSTESSFILAPVEDDDGSRSVSPKVNHVYIRQSALHNRVPRFLCFCSHSVLV